MHNTFEARDFTSISSGTALVGTCKLVMPSGLIISCAIFRGKKDPSSYFVSPEAKKLPAGGYAAVVDFIDDERKAAWQKAALDAVKPHLADLTSSPRKEAHEHAPF